VSRRLALAVVAGALAVMLLPAAAPAGELEADPSDYPFVRAIFVADKSSKSVPTVTENGRPVVNLTATNLGLAKSLVLVVDRSRSMRGQPLDDAVGAARAFVAAKPAEDRIAVATYATEAQLLTGFQTSTTDADSALRSIAVDSLVGTKLYDSIVLSANSLASETYLGRVILIVTDGNETMSEATLEQAIAAAQSAGASVYVVAIESRLFTPEPLQRLADETGGSYFGAASTEALDGVYRSIAEELSRTWRLEWVTASLPGEQAAVVAELGKERSALEVTIPGAAVVERTPAAQGRLPEQFFGTALGQASFAFVIGLIVLVAMGLLLASPKGAWLKGRLDPHLTTTRRTVKPADRERLRVAAGLFRATESAFGGLRPWKAIGRTLERADLPLRTVELVYLMLGGAVVAGLVLAAASASTLLLVAGVGAGALLPYGVVSFKARKRIKAFEEQLPDLLVTMAAALKAGHSFRQAVQSVVDEDQPPASKELQRVLTETRLGRPMDEALVDMSQRLGSKNFEFVITAVTIQRQVGGSLASLFDMVAETVRSRQQFAKKIRGLTAMGRGSAYVLVGLPFFLAGVLTLMNSKYMSPLWHTSTGHKLLMLMIGMMVIGSLILRKLVNFRY
jgi:tight adherence protein B